MHVAGFGDSFLICDHTNCGASGGPTVSANRWLEQIRIQMQEIYGSHGTGVYPVVFSGSSVLSSPSSINPEAWTCAGTFDNTTTALGPTLGSFFGTIHLGNGASCTFHDNRSIAWDTLNTYCMTNTSSGSLAVNIDSGAYTGIACGTTTGSATAHVVALAAASSTAHSVTFTSTGDSYLYAAEGQAGASGVSVDNMGFGGAQASSWGGSSAAQFAFSDLIPGGQQAAIFMDMTNDAANGISTSTFQTNVQNVISHEQALVSAPTVMIAVPPIDVVNGSTSPHVAMAPYTAVLTGLCSSDSLTCVNIQSRGTTVGSTVVGWGTTYNPSLFDQTGTTWPSGSQGVHPNDVGNLDEAQMIYAELVNPVGASGGGGGCSASCSFAGETTFSQTAAAAALTVNDSGQGISAVFNSTHPTEGSLIELSGTASNVDSWVIQSASSSDSPGGKQLLVGDFTNGIYSWKSSAASSGAGVNEFPSLNVTCWSSTGSVTANTCDTGISRGGADVIAFGNGGQGDASAAVSAGSISTSSNTTNTFNAGTSVFGTILSNSNSSGVFLEFTGTGSDVDNWGIGSAGNASVTGGKAFVLGDLTTGIDSWLSTASSSGRGVFELPSLSVPCWSSTDSVSSNACDTGLSRTEAGAVALGNGAAGDASGALSLSTISANLFKGPATAPSGACTTIGWAFSQDGHATFCDGSTWTTKI